MDWIGLIMFTVFIVMIAGMAVIGVLILKRMSK